MSSPEAELAAAEAAMRTPEGQAEIERIAAELRAELTVPASGTVPSTVPRPATAAPDPGQELLRAATALAAVMRYGSLGYEETARHLEGYDAQPYPLTYVVMSNHVIGLLRALGTLEGAAETALASLRPPRRPRYGPPLRES